MSRHCPVKGCGASIPRTKVMCARDWVRLPQSVRQAVAAARNNTALNLSAAVKAAIQAANKMREPKPISPQEELDGLAKSHGIIRQEASDGTVALDVKEIIVTVPAKDAEAG